MNREEFYIYLDTWGNINILVEFLIDHPHHISGIVDIALNDQKRESWRAVWILDKVHEKKPDLISPFIPLFIEKLPKISNESKLRHLLKLISLNPMPEEKLTFLWEYGLNGFTDAARPIAIRVHAMQILYEISELIPEFKPELIQLIEHEMEFHDSAGIRSRGKKLLKKLY